MIDGRRRRVLWGALLVVMVCAAYGPALRAQWVWDDDAHVTANPTLRAVGGLYRIWFDLGALPQYYPLVHTTFWIEYRLWGPRPPGFHLVNILIHAASAVLLWRLLRRLSVPGAWLAAAIFALHPVQVESVAWVTERKNVLSGLFYLASLHAFLGFFKLSDAGRSGERGSRTGLYGIGFALFLAAMLSKTVCASLPVVVGLLIWWKRGRVTRPELLALAPVAAVGATLGLLTAWLEKHHVGAEGAEWGLTAVERSLVAGRALWFYAAKLLWPVDLTFVYPRWQVDPGAFRQYLYPAAAVGAVAVLWALRHRIGRGPVTAVACFVIVLFPALGFFDVYPMRYSYVADHFQYHASVALIAAAAAAGVAALARWPAAGRVAAAVLLGTLATLTWSQSRVYRDAETLWRDTLAKNPRAWMAHNNLGEILVWRGEVEEGIAHYVETLRLKPDHAKARSNLGAALASQGRLEEALVHLEEARTLRPEVPGIRFNLGLVLFQLGRMDEAERELAETLRLSPDHARAHELLANLLAMRGRIDDAVRHLEAALRIDPALASARFNVAGLLHSQGRLERAAAHYREHLTRWPLDGQARLGLAVVLMDQGRLEEAREELETALRNRPDDRGARELLERIRSLRPDGGRP